MKPPSKVEYLVDQVSRAVSDQNQETWKRRVLQGYKRLCQFKEELVHIFTNKHFALYTIMFMEFHRSGMPYRFEEFARVVKWNAAQLKRYFLYLITWVNHFSLDKPWTLREDAFIDSVDPSLGHDDCKTRHALNDRALEAARIMQQRVDDLVCPPEEIEEERARKELQAVASPSMTRVKT